MKCCTFAPSLVATLTKYVLPLIQSKVVVPLETAFGAIDDEFQTTSAPMSSKVVDSRMKTLDNKEPATGPVFFTLNLNCLGEPSVTTASKVSNTRMGSFLVA